MQHDERAASFERSIDASTTSRRAETKDRNSLLATAIGWPLAVPRWVVRFYRRRLSAQLILSHVVVVLLTAGLIAVLLVIAIGNAAGPFGNSTPLLDELSSTAASLAGQTASLYPALSRGPDDPEFQELQRNMQSLVAASTPSPGEPAGSGTIERVLVVSSSGIIIAGSGAGVVPGKSVQSLQPYSSVLTKVVRRAVQLQGAKTKFGTVRVYDNDASSAVAAYPIVSLSGQFLGVAGVEDRLIPVTVSLHHLALAAAATFLVAILLLSIPALLVSIPIGVWRAKAVSRRVERLAQAADAMAQGDLTQQVEVKGADEIARLGDRFNTMSASLREADESRRAFVSNVSHDLRTPLAIIQGNVERLIDQAHQVKSDTTSTARLESIQTEVETLDHLVGDLFTLARLDEAVLKVQSKPMALLPVIREVVDGIKTIARAQQQVSIEIARTEMFIEPLPTVLADELRVRQILANLIYNSLRHTPEGGVIIVSARAAGGFAEVSVTDTGVGIAPEELPNVFDRNYRATNHAGFGYREGGGLGLAIVKQLVEAQHGRITVESRPGEGSVFSFTLPVEPSDR